MKFRAGDKVRIRKGLERWKIIKEEIGYTDFDPGLTEEMIAYGGKIVEVEKAGVRTLRIKNDPRCYTWIFPWIEKIDNQNLISW